MAFKVEDKVKFLVIFIKQLYLPPVENIKVVRVYIPMKEGRLTAILDI